MEEGRCWCFQCFKVGPKDGVCRLCLLFTCLGPQQGLWMIWKLVLLKPLVSAEGNNNSDKRIGTAAHKTLINAQDFVICTMYVCTSIIYVWVCPFTLFLVCFLSFFIVKPNGLVSHFQGCVTLIYEGVRCSSAWAVKVRVLNSRWRVLSYCCSAVMMTGCCSDKWWCFSNHPNNKKGV